MSVNTIKYSTSSLDHSTLVGSVAFGWVGYDYGPSEVSGWYNGVTPPSGGYVVYATSASQIISATVANNSNELINVAQQLTYQPPLTGSLLFNGSNQSLGLNPGVIFGAGAFTLEGWFYNNSSFNNKGIIGSPVTSPVGCMNLYFANDTTITSDRNGGGGSFSYTMGSAITTNAWHYLIYNRNAGGLTAIYIDGVRCNATSSDTLNYNTATDTIGRYYGGYWPGYWTNMRMTVGTAVYNSSLTTQPTPIGPLTSLANTKYLMLGDTVTTDSSGIQTVTNNNGVTQTSVVPNSNQTFTSSSQAISYLNANGFAVADQVYS
jgi:hypothetical protein